MNDQVVTYSSLRFLQSASESQSRLGHDATQRPKTVDDKGSLVPWRLAAVTLGIFCFLLLVTVIVLVTNVFQYIQEKHQQQEILENLNQSCRNDKYLNNQLLTNKSLECDSLKKEILMCEKKMKYPKTKCPGKNEILGTKGSFCQVPLFCCGAKCYHFIQTTSTWEGCKQICQWNELSLLKYDGEDEWNFLKSWACGKNYWIGLSYDVKESRWKWVDGSTAGIPSVVNRSILRRKCAFLAPTREDLAECSNTYNCICEKRLDSVL